MGGSRNRAAVLTVQVTELPDRQAGGGLRPAGEVHIPAGDLWMVRLDRIAPYPGVPSDCERLPPRRFSGTAAGPGNAGVWEAEGVS